MFHNHNLSHTFDLKQKITLEHRNFDNPTVNTDFNTEEVDSNIISKSLDTTVLKDQTAAKAEFIGTRFLMSCAV